MTKNDIIIKMMKTAISEGKTEDFISRTIDIYQHHFSKYHSLKEIMIEAGRELSL